MKKRIFAALIFTFILLLTLSACNDEPIDAPETPNEKPDYSLYYSMVAFAEKELAQLNEKIQNANDWEKIELEERIDGLKFAKECLDEAWQRRKDVIA